MRLLDCQIRDPQRGPFDPTPRVEPDARHRDKTRQDNMAARNRPRVHEHADRRRKS